MELVFLGLNNFQKDWHESNKQKQAITYMEVDSLLPDCLKKYIEFRTIEKS